MERVKIELEFMFKASPSIIYLFVTNPSCIIRWFSDKVDNTGDHYTFTWNGEDEEADMVDDLEDELVRYVWRERPDEFLQFRIYKTDITNETILEIIDFCDADEKADQRIIWENYIKRFKIACGG